MDAVLVVLRVILSLAAVLGVLWIVQRRVSKGPRSARSARLVSVVSRQGIAQKASVVVVDVEGKRFLLGVTEHSVTVLDRTELEVAEVVESEKAEQQKAERPVRPAGGSAAAFGTALARAKGAPPFAGAIRFDPRTGQPRTGMLDGSILSPATWRRAAGALRGRR